MVRSSRCPPPPLLGSGRAYRVWAESHRRDTPLLSDAAISRESICADGRHLTTGPRAVQLSDAATASRYCLEQSPPSRTQF